MGKFVRQSVITWPQFRTNIKNKTHVFEGKEYVGWDLPMNEQIRLFRIQEAQITEIANFANFTADANAVSTANSTGKTLYKKPVTAQVATFKFADGVSSGSISGSFGSGSGQNYFDVYCGYIGDPGKKGTNQATTLAGFGNVGCRFAIFSASLAGAAVSESAATTLPAGFALLTASYDGAGGLDNTGATVPDILHAFTASLANAVAGATVVGKTQPYKPSDHFSLALTSGSVGDKNVTMTITSTNAGAVNAPVSAITTATGSVTVTTKGADKLCGSDGTIWSNSPITSPSSYAGITRII